MKRRVISSLLAVSMLIALMPALPAAAEQTAENNSVSGYISLTEGLQIAGADIATVICFDDSEYEGVKIAAQNLAEDIEHVTGKKAEINPSSEDAGSGETPSEDENLKRAAISEINSSEGTMTISNYEFLEAQGRGIIAIYNDSILSRVYLSENLADNTNGTLRFGTLPEFGDNEVKGFLWEEDTALTCNPLADVFLAGTSEPAEPEDNDAEIIIGTLGMSEAVDELAENDVIDVTDIEGKWEAFTIQETGDGKIVIAGSDKRGTIYGIYDLCEKIGVSPWTFWADVEPERAEKIYINLPENGYTEGEPSVKYRGIFLNDEFNLSGWSKSLSDDGSNMNNETYEKIFELLLRLKANYLWPAMHEYSTAFNATEHNAELADKYGIVMGSSHAEPLLRNNLGELVPFQAEWEAAHPDKTLYKYRDGYDLKQYDIAWRWTDANDVANKEFLTDYWKARVEANGEYENTYTLGMRGVHDGAFNGTKDDLQEIINVQTQILTDEAAKLGVEVKDIPQVFIPYKEILEHYNKDLVVPDYVTLMWTDDNFGYIRQLPTEEERKRSGGAGIYYHLSYYGNPSSYLWISSTQPGLIREEMTKAYDKGAQEIWVANVGDLKPAETEIEYFLDLARDVEAVKNKDISDWLKENAKRDFGFDDAHAEEYAEIKLEYSELANSNRPEFIRSGNFSLTAYGDEAERYMERYEDICSKAEALYRNLPADKKDAFFELALYPIRGAKNMAVNYIQTDRAKLYAEQKRGQSANTYAAQAEAAVGQIKADVKVYNEEIAGGKWNGIMNINPSHFIGCDMPLKYDQLQEPSVKKLDYTKLAVMTEAQAEYSDNPSMTISAYDSYDKYIDVINQGYGSFDYVIESDNDAIIFDKTSATVYGSDRVHIGVDKKKAATGTTTATVTVSQLLGGKVVDAKEIAVTISNPADVPTDDKTYVETNGTVSIEAEHFSRKTDKAIDGGSKYEWRVEKDFGRSGDSLKIYPNDAADIDNTADAIKESSAYAEYDIYFTTPGTYTVNIYRMPTLNAIGACRVAVGLDEADPDSIGGTINSPTGSSAAKRGSGNSWVNQVLANTEVLKTTFNNVTAGKHTLRLYNVSAGMVIDKIVLTQNNVTSYFGAPESYNTTYNNSKLTKTSTETAPAAEVTKIYEPKAIVGVAARADSKITVPIFALGDVTDAVVAVTSYDENGGMTSVDFAKVTFAGGEAEAELNLSADAENYAITVFDSFTDLHPLAPYKEYGNIVTNAGSLSIKTDMSDYDGKKSIVLIADKAIDEAIEPTDIKYLHGETAAENSYKKIPFSAEGGNKYYINIGIDGETAVTEEFEAAPVQYTIQRELKDGNSVAAAELDSGTSYSGSTVSVSDLPIVISDGGKYYILSEDSDETFRREWTLGDEAEQTFTVTYTLDENIVAYAEFEDFGKNVIESKSYSKGKAGYLSDNTVIKLMDNPSAGNYELTASVVNNKGNGFKLKYGNNSDVANTEWAPELGIFSAEFTMSDSGDLSELRMSKNGTNSPTFDYIIIRQVPADAEYTVEAVTPLGEKLDDITPVEKTSLKISGLPEVIENDGEYYRVSDSMVGKNTHTKRITHTVTEGDVVTVEYTLDEHIKFYAEMEDYEGINTPMEASASYSKGAAAYLQYDKFAKLGEAAFPAGKYEFEGYIVGRGNSVGLRFKQTEGDSSNLITIPCPISDKNNPGTYKYAFELQEATTLVMAGLSNSGGQAGTPTFDYILIRAVSDK